MICIGKLSQQPPPQFKVPEHKEGVVGFDYIQHRYIYRSDLKRLRKHPDLPTYIDINDPIFKVHKKQLDEIEAARPKKKRKPKRDYQQEAIDEILDNPGYYFDSK